jgi:nucleoside-diphosphate-sugar epimerase
MISSRKQRFRTVAVEDLAHQLVHLIDEPRSFGQHYDVGADDVYTIDQMIDLTADHLGRSHPVKIHLPRGLIACLAPVVERAAGMAPGAVGGFVGKGSDADMVGDARPIRALLDRAPEPFAEAMARSVKS